VVAFVASEFHEIARLRVHEDLYGPGGREDRVVDGGLIADLLGPRAREALDDSKLVAHDGVQHLHAVVVPMRYLVRGLDDERVALETAARVTRPLAHVRRQVRAPVDRND